MSLSQSDRHRLMPISSEISEAFFKEFGLTFINASEAGHTFTWGQNEKNVSGKIGGESVCYQQYLRGYSAKLAPVPSDKIYARRGS